MMKIFTWNIPIWLFHKSAARVSNSLRGCADVTIEYRRLDDLRDELPGQLLSIVERIGFRVDVEGWA